MDGGFRPAAGGVTRADSDRRDSDGDCQRRQPAAAVGLIRRPSIAQGAGPAGEDVTDFAGLGSSESDARRPVPGRCSHGGHGCHFKSRSPGLRLRVSVTDWALSGHCQCQTRSAASQPGRACEASTHWSDSDNWPAARGLPSPAAPRAQIPAEGLSPGGPPADNTSFTLCIRVSNTSFTLYIRVASRTEKSSDRAAGRAAHGNRNNGREWG